MTVYIIVSSTRETPRTADQTYADVSAALGEDIRDRAALLEGRWAGVSEYSLAVPVRGTGREIHAVASSLRERLHQQSVMILAPADDSTVPHWIANGGSHADVYPAAGTVANASTQVTGRPIVDVPLGVRWVAVPTANGAYVVAYV